MEVGLYRVIQSQIVVIVTYGTTNRRVHVDMGNIGGLEVLRTKTTTSLATKAIDRTNGEIMTNL